MTTPVAILAALVVGLALIVGLASVFWNPL